MDNDSKVGSFLTDGTGVSPFTVTKWIKDFVADFLITAAAALATVQIMDLGAAVQSPEIVGFAVAGAFVKAGYRIVLRWATS